jgi:hypothetical protein
MYAKRKLVLTATHALLFSFPPSPCWVCMCLLLACLPCLLGYTLFDSYVACWLITVATSSIVNNNDLYACLCAP